MNEHRKIKVIIRSIQRQAFDFKEKPFKSSRLYESNSKSLQSAVLIKLNPNLKTNFKVTDYVLCISQSIQEINSFIECVGSLYDWCFFIGNKYSEKERMGREIYN